MISKSKIGIITFHKSHNYGTLLQALAMKRFLTHEGFSAEFVNYWPKYRRGMFSVFDFRYYSAASEFHQKLYLTLRNVLSTLLSFPWRMARNRRFKDFIDSEIISLRSPEILRAEDIFDNCDKYVFGSDQIWRYNDLPNFKGFDSVYWGGIPQLPDHKKVAYAASMGKLVINENNLEFIKSKLSRFSSIAVREADLKERIQPLLDIKISLVLDPVFLVTEDSWRDTCSEAVVSGREYVLLYNLTRSKDAANLAEDLAKKYGCEVVEICGTVNPLRVINSRRYKLNVGPREFLALVRDAKFVVSTSFHGVAFSLIFGKEFFSLGMGENSARVRTLLEGCGLLDRYLTSTVDVSSVPKIDYASVKNKLEFSIKASSEILVRSLS